MFAAVSSRIAALSWAARATASVSEGSVALNPSRNAVRRSPSAVTRFSASTWSVVRPWRTEWLPHASLPMAPPRVARDWLEGSGAKVSSPSVWAATWCCRVVSTMPACATAVLPCGSTEMSLFMCREKSSTTPVPIALPPMPVPPPRAVSVR